MLKKYKNITCSNKIAKYKLQNKRHLKQHNKSPKQNLSSVFYPATDFSDFEV